MELDEHVDIVRMQLEQEVKRKIQFSPDPAFIKFGIEKLQLQKSEVITIYLSTQTTKLKQLIQRLHPLKLKQVHPL